MAANLARRQVKVEFSVKLPYKMTKRPKWFLSSCPILDVQSQGPTLETAKKNLVEAISLFLISCIERGTLDEVLNKCGFVPIHGFSAPLKATPATEEENYISVPIPFLVHPGPECHA
jgi:predicted RNase H-like HicB family nuclease